MELDRRDHLLLKNNKFCVCLFNLQEYNEALWSWGPGKQTVFPPWHKFLLWWMFRAKLRLMELPLSHSSRRSVWFPGKRKLSLPYTGDGVCTHCPPPSAAVRLGSQAERWGGGVLDRSLPQVPGGSAWIRCYPVPCEGAHGMEWLYSKLITLAPHPSPGAGY